MCRLFAIYGIYDQWRSAVLDFCRQAETGKIPPGAKAGHKDGWGMAAARQTDGKMVVLNRQLAPASIEQFQKTLDPITSPPRNLLCHLRKASPGIAVSHKNLHPFFDGGWTFIHNGTLYGAQSLPRNNSYQCVSDNSDTEFLFHYLLSEIMVKPEHQSIPESLAKAILKMTIDYTSLTSVLCCSDRMIVIRHFKKHPHYYTLYRCRLPHAVLLASEPVRLKGHYKDQPWELLPNHSMTVISGKHEIVEESHAIIETE